MLQSDHFLPLLFPKDSKFLKILDIRLWEVWAKRRLNGTSKVNRRTDGHADGHFDLKKASAQRADALKKDFFRKSIYLSTFFVFFF